MKLLSQLIVITDIFRLSDSYRFQPEFRKSTEYHYRSESLAGINDFQTSSLAGNSLSFTVIRRRE